MLKKELIKEYNKLVDELNEANEKIRHLEWCHDIHTKLLDKATKEAV